MTSAMFPTRYSNLFRSRWAALAWAAGICWTAVQIADSSEARPDPVSANATSDDAADAANLNQLETLVGKLE